MAGGTSELYDPDRGTRTATGKMTTPRHSQTAILLSDGKVPVAGGRRPCVTRAATDAAELYESGHGNVEPPSRTCTPSGDSMEAFLQPDGKVLVVGSSRGEPRSAELFDPATRAWTATGSRPSSITETATLMSDGTMLLAGLYPNGESEDAMYGRAGAVQPAGPGR